jgi:O2-independent ubiquinone biosynthesis protein UbiV
MSSTAQPWRLSLGPLQFHWPKQQMLDFYRDIESSAVDIVYLGETVCSKRREFGHGDWMMLAERMLDSGKQVVLSTLALVEAQSELGYMQRLCDNGQFMVEANDMSAVRMLHGNTPFVGGATLNIQNQHTLQVLTECGLVRWVAPHEMPSAVMTAIAAAAPDEIECEVFGWGRMPIAYSARCYTTRALDIPKDQCKNCCIQYADGLMMSTREEEEFLVINGIQTMSAKTTCLAQEFHAGEHAADILRINPQAHGTSRIIELLQQLRDGAANADLVTREMATFAPGGLCNGYWHGAAGMTCCAGLAGQ